MAGAATLDLQQARSLRITRTLRQAIGLLRFSNHELAAFLAFHDAVNPHLALQAASAPPEPARHGAQASGPISGGASVELIASAPSGLQEHVRREIRLVLTSEAEISIGAHFVEALEPTGWLGRSVEEIARSAGCEQAAAAAVLTKIQRIEPSGLFARSLAECLRLQAADAEVLTRELSCLLDNLPLLAQGEFEALAHICGCDRKSIIAHFATIRGFNPKPGLAFGAEIVSTAAPDLIARAGNDGITVELNRSTLPTISVRDEDGVTPADQRMLDAAKAVARAVERRNITTLQIATEILRRQAKFFRSGATALQPLTLREIAQATGVHESTVSRVTAGLRMETPRGPIGLRDFFSGGLATESGRISAVEVQSRIGRMIEAEDPARPLSDTIIAAELSRQGIRIARRTVAKYREKLGIAGTATRRVRKSSRAAAQPQR